MQISKQHVPILINFPPASDLALPMGVPLCWLIVWVAALSDCTCTVTNKKLCWDCTLVQEETAADSPNMISQVLVTRGRGSTLASTQKCEHILFNVSAFPIVFY